MITSLQAFILGIVEGVTEFLPISSTGHLILAGQWLGIHGESAKIFEVIIQGGALLAVLGLYRRRILQMWKGILGQDADGRFLFFQLAISFLPVSIVGLIFHKQIKQHLFNPASVAIALAIGGIAMIIVEWVRGQNKGEGGISLFPMIYYRALLIGLAQVLSLWPGTSRSMVTILAALLLGFTPAAAAEYSFLLALPTLGAAVGFDLAKSGSLLYQQIPLSSFLIGFFTSAIVAAIAIKFFISYLNRHGLSFFGWYRIVLAVLVWVFVK